MLLIFSFLSCVTFNYDIVFYVIDFFGIFKIKTKHNFKIILKNKNVTKVSHP